MRGYKVRGLADIAFIAIIGVMIFIGAIANKVTGKVDSPMEQLAEKVIELKTGQEVDFSAHLKKDENGNLIVTEKKTKVVPPNGVTKTTIIMPSDYSK